MATECQQLMAKPRRAPRPKVVLNYRRPSPDEARLSADPVKVVDLTTTLSGSEGSSAPR